MLVPDADGRSGDDPEVLHVVGVHGDGVDDCLILRVVLADVDLLPLLAGAARIHRKSPARHQSSPARNPISYYTRVSEFRIWALSDPNRTLPDYNDLSAGIHGLVNSFTK